MTPNQRFDPSQPSSIQTLQVIFKVVERCNIDCTYCYYFNMGETTPLQRPPVVSPDTTSSIARWIAHGCQQLGIPQVSISFHGGEPMMLKPHNFEAICEILTQKITPVAQLSFSIQTNGTILNDQWLALFRKYSVRVGVSIDGDRDAHDRFRLDRRGQSTFEVTEKNLKRLVEWANGDERVVPATISVLDSRNDYRQVYGYLRSLGIEQMSFLLPDRNRDAGFSDGEDAEAYGRSLFEIFEAWLTEDNPNIFIRYVHETLRHFQVAPPPERDTPTTPKKRAYQIIVIQSDGKVTVNDSYIPALSWYSKAPAYSTSDSSLKDLLRDDVFQEIEEARSTLASECQTCEWKKICKGGDLENRFSDQNGFDNPSIYCEGYKFFYRNVCKMLLENGYPAELMKKTLPAAVQFAV